MVKRRRQTTASFVVALLWLSLSTSLSFAQNRDREYRIELDFGYRWNAYFRGSRDLYRTQLDLGEGPKLFGVNLFYSPAEGETNLFDRLELKMNDWGGEPYNTAHFRMAKNGVYEFSFFYQNIKYFNSIPSFANPFFEKGNREPQHKHDTSLRTGGFDLVFVPGKMISPYISYQRTSRQGPVRTTIAADGDEFLVDSELDIHSDNLSGGLVFNFRRLSLRLEQGARWYRDETSFVASHPQAGNLPGTLIGREIVLDKYSGQNDFGTRAVPYSQVSGTFRPIGSLRVSGSVSYSMPDTRTNFYDSFTGNFFSFPTLRAFYSGGESATSGISGGPNIFAEVAVEWMPSDWFRLKEHFRTHRYHISGAALTRQVFLNVDPILSSRMVDAVESEIALDQFIARDLDIQEIEGQFSIRPDLTLRVGHRYEGKDLKVQETYSYERNVLLLGAAYRHSARNRFSVDYELGRTDQPIVRTDPVDFDRVRVQGQFSPVDSIEVSGRYSMFDHDSDLVGFVSRNRTYGLGFSYAPIDRLSVSGQWERNELDTEIPYLIPQLLMSDQFSFREFGNYGNLYLNLILVRNAQLSLGYSVWGNSGNFPVNYHQPTAKLEIPLCERLLAYGQWNYYDYNEKLSGYPQDYRTHLATFGFRVSMGN